MRKLSSKISGQISWVNAPKQAPKNKLGFVYIITELDTGKFYIGIKKYWNKIKRKPLKGKKRVRRDLIESDWRTYNSSNKELQDKIKKNPNNYKKEILENCETITQMKATEAFIQLGYYVSGEWDSLYNEMINLRIRIR